MKIAREIAKLFDPEPVRASDSVDRILRPAITKENLASIIAAKLEPMKVAMQNVVLDENCDSVVMAIRGHASWILSVQGYEESSLVKVSQWFNDIADRIEALDEALAMFEEAS
ncbi:MAG: hypothetical protein U9Q07_02805 [Planctomycetota bacterium]|nr:hypothetical protein [Planctomycetota bacterium]